MALFNYSSQYSTISPKLTATANSAEWLKIFVSPDTSGGGHLITHGIDFGASYNNGTRGLVPVNSASDLTKTYLRGDGWASFWSSTDQATAAGTGTIAQQQINTEAYLRSALVSAYDIKQWIAQSFTANDAMRFKGTITVAQNNSISYNDGSNHTGFPTSCEVGDTYKVTSTTNKTLAGQNVNSGDMLICIKAGSGSSLNDAQYWTVVQSNVESLTQYTINGAAHFIYTQNNVGGTFFAPTSGGNQGQVLQSAGSSAPTWVNQSTLVVGEAGKVTNYLTKGAGLSFRSQNVEMPTGRYNGSEAVTISVSPATTSAIGGVIIDGGTHSPLYDNNNSNNKKPTVTVTSDGEIYLTPDNIINALGYTPENSVNLVARVVVANSASVASNTTAAISNPYVNIIAANNTILGSYQIKGNGAISVKSIANSAALTISGSVFTNSMNGLVPMASDANKQNNNVDNIASSDTFLLGANAKWYKLPLTAFVGTWRNIKVNNVEILDTTVTNGKALNLVAGSHVTISALTTNDAYDGRVQIAAAWRDVQIHKITTNNGSTSIDSSVATIGTNDPLVFDNSESIFTVGEEVTVGGATKTVVKSYIVWYNMDDLNYELV